MSNKPDYKDYYVEGEKHSGYDFDQYEKDLEEWMDKTPRHYFTFGQSHRTIDDVPMKDFWVTVIADDPGTARTKFVEQFTSKYMHNESEFAFQYNEKNFKPEFYPLGELIEIL